MTTTNVLNNAPLIVGTPNQVSVSLPVTAPALTLATPVTTSTQPMFAVYLSNTEASVTGDGTVHQITYDTVLVNQGSSYNNSNGQFTVPVSGNYLFTTCNITSTSDITTGYSSSFATSASATIYYATYYVGTFSSGIFKPMDGSIILPLTIGTTVTVSVTVSGQATKVASLRGSSSTIYTYWCGWLML